MENVNLQSDKIMVSVGMITYNHEPYIRKAIEGIVCQSVQFPIELVIGEDCSTDGTRSVCIEYQKKYPRLIRLLPSERNLGMKENSLRTIRACTGKYLALCEGDDYWTDPFKLQKQVEFLEKNHDFGLVHTNHIIIDKNGYFIRNKNSYGVHNGFVFRHLLYDNFITTPTVLVRMDLFKKALFNNKQVSDALGDYAIWLKISKECKFHYLSRKTAAYRILNDSASHSSDSSKTIEFYRKGYNVAMETVDPENSKLVRLIKIRHYSRILKYLLRSGHLELMGEFYHEIKTEPFPNLVIFWLFRIIYRFPFIGIIGKSALSAKTFYHKFF